MKRILVAVLFIIALSIAWEVQREIAADKKQTLALTPPLPGVYYKASGGWTRLAPQLYKDFRGHRAPVQIDESRPTFYVKEASLSDTLPNRLLQSPDNWVLVGFDKKKARPSNDHLPGLLVTRISEHVFTLTPFLRLPPGQYLLVHRMTESGFDFGVR